MHKKTLATLAAFAMIAASSGAALAVPYCQASAGQSFRTMDFDGRFRTDTEAQSSYFESRLRDQGIVADDAEIWNGCVRAWVQTSTGQEQQFFDPRSMRRVQ